MIILKDNPVGIDKEILKFQKYLEYRLSDWNLQIYGRSEIIDKKLLIYYKKNDYIEALVLDSQFNGRVFFKDSSNSIIDTNKISTSIEIIFLLNIKNIMPDISHRSDEEIRVELINLISKKVGGQIKVLKGQEVLDKYSTKLIDMQPYHFLSFSFDYSYSQHNCFN
ncbi:hypothetical protein [Tenacibaculum sp. 190524A05c]|uniref:hypothetical protein n=1 Tax=Tenacibaculum platacis TaxID=3137852 RepID=UPI0031FB3ECE